MGKRKFGVGDKAKVKDRQLLLLMARNSGKNLFVRRMKWYILERKI